MTLKKSKPTDVYAEKRSQAKTFTLAIVIPLVGCCGNLECLAIRIR